MLTIANEEMAKAWDGEEGDRWTEHADRYDAAGRRHRKRFLDAGAVASKDRVLDIGCGTGKSTRDAARAAATGSVLGVDLSARMLALARERSAAEGLANVAFEQADAQVHGFEDSAFDVAISSFGAMFFADPPAAFTNIARALRPGGRLAMLAWRDPASNAWLQALLEALAVGRPLPTPPVGVPGPFGLADPDHVRAILGNAGFTDVALDIIDEPMEFGVDAVDAYGFVSTMGVVHGMTHELDEAMAAKALEAVQEMLAAHETPEGVLIDSSAWLISASIAQ